MSTQKITFIEAFEEASIRHKDQGYQTHIRNLKLHILPYFKDVDDVSTIKKKDIINWENKILDKNFSNAFNSNLYYTFSSLIKYFILSDYMTENVVLLVGNFVKKTEKKNIKSII